MKRQLLPDVSKCNWLIFAVFSMMGLNAMATTTSGTAGTVTSDGSGSASFTNTAGGVGAADDDHTTCVVTATNGYTDTLFLTNFGINLTDGDDIEGVQVDVEWHKTGGTIKDNAVMLVLGGLSKGNNLVGTAATLPTSDATTTYGSSSELWGLSLADTDIDQVATFGVAIICKVTGATDATALIDAVTITVTHSTPAAATFTAQGSGDWDVAGTWDQGASIPTSADDVDIPVGITVTVPASVTASCLNLTMNSGSAAGNVNVILAGTTANCSLVVANNLVMKAVNTGDGQGNLEVNDGYLSVAGTTTINAMKSGANTFHNKLTVNNGHVVLNGATTTASDAAGANSEIDMTGGTGATGIIEFNGPLTLYSKADVLNSTGTIGTMVFGENGAQTIYGGAGMAYYRLQLSGSGAKTLGGAATVNENFIFDGTATYNNGGAALTYGASVVLEYAGSSVQTTGDELNGVAVPTLIINNANGVVLGSDVQVNTQLTLTAGKVTLGANNLTIAAAATISGGSASNYIVTTGTGTLNQAGIGITGRTGSVLFPIGYSTAKYTPITISNAGVDDQFDIRVANELFEDYPATNAQTDGAVNLSWYVTEGLVGGSVVTMTTQWNSSEHLGSFDKDNAFISHYNSGTSAWEQMAMPAVASGSDPYSMTAIGITSFSPFAVADNSGNVLPIELISFEVEPTDRGNVVEWATASELNNDWFDIERSANSADFSPIANIPGAGDSDDFLAYEWLDEHPIRGISYYRLKQTDFDGKHTYSDAVAVASHKSPEKSLFSVYPNPVKPGGQIRLDPGVDYVQGEEILVVLQDMMGRKLYSKTIIARGESDILLGLESSEKLPPGVYLIIGSTSDQFDRMPIVIE